MKIKTQRKTEAAENETVIIKWLLTKPRQNTTSFNGLLKQTLEQALYRLLHPCN